MLPKRNDRKGGAITQGPPLQQSPRKADGKDVEVRAAAPQSRKEPSSPRGAGGSQPPRRPSAPRCRTRARVLPSHTHRADLRSPQDAEGVTARDLQGAQAVSSVLALTVFQNSRLRGCEDTQAALGEAHVVRNRPPAYSGHELSPWRQRLSPGRGPPTPGPWGRARWRRGVQGGVQYCTGISG